jgi:hypothetical protein
MSDELLQTIVEKLEALEIALLKQDNESANTLLHRNLLNEIKACKSGIEGLSTEVNNFSKKMEVQMLRFDAFTRISDKHRQDQTIHHHRLHKGLWVSVGLFILVGLLAVSLFNSRTDLKRYEANDIKYRLLKVKADTVVLRRLYKTDSIYNENPDAVKKATIQEELRIAERARLFQLASEKEKEAKALIRKARRY